MNRSAKAALAVAAIALTASVAHANDEQILDNCIQHFIASNLSGYQGKISVHKEAPALALPFSATGVMHVVVSAAGKQGTDFGSAVCHVDRDGNVVSLTPVSPTIRVSKAPAKPVLVAGSGE